MFEGFEHQPIDEMSAVGHVGPHHAVIWLRAAASAKRIVRCRSAAADARISGGVDASEAEAIATCDEVSDYTATVELRHLNADHAYQYEVEDPSAQRIVATGKFRTAPLRGSAGPDEYCFSLSSCHMPFLDHGERCPRSHEMLQNVAELSDQLDTRFHFDLGDQMYADLPAQRSLFLPSFFSRIAPPGRKRLLDCTAEEVRAIYQRRHHVFWSFASSRKLRSSRPTYAMWDDHEVVDNWGSDPAHAEKPWDAIRRGSREAYQNYQGALFGAREPGAEPDFDQVFDYGDISLYVLDLRSNRTGGEQGRLISQTQKDRLAEFVRTRGEQAVLFFVLSVPLVHGPRWALDACARLFPSGLDFGDRWSVMGHRRDRDEFLELLHAHQQTHRKQKIVFLSGDVHVGALQRIDWSDGAGTIYQFTSSAVSNDGHRGVRRMSGWIMRMVRNLKTESGRKARVRLMPIEGQNPVAALNFGVVHLRRGANDTREIQFELFGSSGDQCTSILRSAWI